MSFVVSICSLPDWDAFARASPDGSIFNMLPFLEQLEEVSFEPWIVSHRGKPVLGVTLLKDRDGNLRNRGYPWARAELLRGVAATTGAVHSQVKENLEAFEALLAELRERYRRISLRTAPGLDDLRPLLWFNHDTPAEGQFRVALHYTGFIEVKSAATFDDYLSRIRPARRRQIRLAHKAGLRMVRSDDVEVLDYLHDLTFQRQGIARDELEVKLLRRIATAAIARGFGDIHVAQLPSGEPASATLFLHDARRGHYFAGANHPEHRGTHSGTLCFAESIRCCYERGVEHIDVCGINSPNRGDFKVSFDAVPKAYFDAVWQRPTPE